MKEELTKLLGTTVVIYTGLAGIRGNLATDYGLFYVKVGNKAAFVTFKPENVEKIKPSGFETIIFLK